MSMRLTTEEFIRKASKVHNNKFDYTKTKYKTNNGKVIIICPEHGEFTQRAADHMQGRGCRKCQYTSFPRYTTEEFIQKATKVHGKTYIYNKVNYNFNRDKITITCPIHGDFIQTPNDHLQGKGCQACGSLKSTGGVHLDNPCILYYFKISNVWKIGVTGKGLAKRYNKVDYSKLENVLTWEFTTGKEALEFESQILLKYYKYRYRGVAPFSDNTGTTECFTHDIYNLWEEENGLKRKNNSSI